MRKGRLRSRICALPPDFGLKPHFRKPCDWESPFLLQRSPSRWIGGAALIPRAAVAPAMGSRSRTRFTEDLTANGKSPLLYFRQRETWANPRVKEKRSFSKLPFFRVAWGSEYRLLRLGKWAVAPLSSVSPCGRVLATSAHRLVYSPLAALSPAAGSGTPLGTLE